MEYSMTMIKWILIIILLSILGINIFSYFAQVTDVSGKIAEEATREVVGATKQAVKMSAIGSKVGIDSAENVLTGGLGELEKAIDVQVVNKPIQTPKPDNSDSDIQQPKKSGYCFIGEEKGYRSCLYVGKRDTCMSGDIFPTMDVCINPNLRA